MAAVRCEYCGSYISDTQENCPVCGAVNKDFKRMVDGTPKTIEDLKNWYIARKLPPEETTRFFIGKDIKEPRAFGIYEKNGEFIVYKNKANGERATRYRGKDESYAVNEIYLKLKEEILNQKNLNAKKQRTQADDRYLQSKKKYDRKRKRAKSKAFAISAITIIILSTILPMIMVFSLFSILSGDYNSEYYFLSENEEVYFYEGNCKNHDGYSWWKYDEEDEKWEFFEAYDDEEEFPEGVIKDKKYSTIYDLSAVTGKDVDIDKADIWKSKEYIDDGHHLNPSNSYYYYNDNLYYFLDDYHSSYGSRDNTGWYKYNGNDWEYYCGEDDKSIIGDDLWYDESEYRVGSSITDVYTYVGDYTSTWNPTDFSDTSWYQSYESNEDAYDRHLEESRNNDNNNSYDNDSDWDWDSDSDWDSGGTDWDSDW